MARRKQEPDVLPIRIRANLVVTVTGLPHDLTRTEALKIAGVIEALGNPERPAYPEAVDETGGWRGPSLADVVRNDEPADDLDDWVARQSRAGE